MSRQSSLTSFFGGGNVPKKKDNESSKKKKIQTKIVTVTKRNDKTDFDVNKKERKKRKIVDDLVDTDDESNNNEKDDMKKIPSANDKSSDVSLCDESEKKISTKTSSAKDTKELSKVKIMKEEEVVEDVDNDDEEFEMKDESESSDEMEYDSEVSNEDDVKLNELKKEKSETPKKTSNKAKQPKKIEIEDINLDEIPWKGKVPFSVLCETFIAIETISSRLQIQDILTKLFQKALLVAPEDVVVLIYLASNTVAPAYDCVELGIGDSILEKAIGEASGTNTSIIKQKYRTEGDLGNVAQMARAKQKTLIFAAKPKPLMAIDVLSVFRKIATTSGSKSQKFKVDIIKGLLVRAQGQEAKFIIRGLQGKLRIGLAQSTVLISLARALTLTVPKTIKKLSDDELEMILKGKTKEKYSNDAKTVCNPKVILANRLESATNIIKKAYSEVPSYDTLVKAALSVPLCKLHQSCSFQPGIPVSPMLAKPTKSVQEVLKRLNGLRFTCEYKYDGERAQVHMTPDGTTKVFSRSLLDTSEKYPEVPEYVQESCRSTNVKSFVLDTEVVAFNKETNQFVPFQILSTRKKTEESSESAKVRVIVQAFDLMYLNGKSLLDRTLAERRDLLFQHFIPVSGKFQYAKSLDHKENGDTTIVEEFLDAAVKGQCEGLMVKTLDENAYYEPSRRSLNWLKLKKDYLEGLGDSVDLVPIGAYHGRGKRTGVYGAYLLACYDLDTETFQSVCKIGTGFSEEDLKTLAEGLNKHIIEKKSSQYCVSETLDCDIWFDTVQVWEVKAADLSKSSTHKGAVDKTGETGRGIGLRFPRFERLRDDKKPEQATSSDQILEMYYAQDSVLNETWGNDDGI